MIKTISLLPGVVLRCMQDRRFKQGCLSIQMVRLMNAEESAMNALLPSVLLRATEHYPDLRAITAQLDMLYGAAVGPIVRRIGDYQTVGLYCGFMEDRFALPGDQILGPMIDFVREVLLNCAVENGHFLPEIVESEKKNLIATIESERNDKRAYAMGCLLKNMCRNDSFGLPRLGEKEQVAAIVKRMLKLEYMPRRLDATDGMAVALCHYYYSSSPINQALGDTKVKGLGGDKKARKRGSQSWEQFLRENPERVK